MDVVLLVSCSFSGRYIIFLVDTIVFAVDCGLTIDLVNLSNVTKRKWFYLVNKVKNLLQKKLQSDPLTE